ncbi:hypothetical protein [Agromyces seonyuensis]|uniref:DUF2637 domain-containing protein n=1 Tax=Agromyces seonyuensis TaxID=2662446 RepID=A0A6I4NZW4_9MICO|nr:hypothetical protein [Agromyces seonyuensis]MWB99903.1 hypothetical protein [Agromyces seonyuensis]
MSARPITAVQRAEKLGLDGRPSTRAVARSLQDAALRSIDRSAAERIERIDRTFDRAAAHAAQVAQSPEVRAAAAVARSRAFRASTPLFAASIVAAFAAAGTFVVPIGGGRYGSNWADLPEVSREVLVLQLVGLAALVVAVAVRRRAAPSLAVSAVFGTGAAFSAAGLVTMTVRMLLEGPTATALVATALAVPNLVLALVLAVRTHRIARARPHEAASNDGGALPPRPDEATWNTLLEAAADARAGAAAVFASLAPAEAARFEADYRAGLEVLGRRAGVGFDAARRLRPLEAAAARYAVD